MHECAKEDVESLLVGKSANGADRGSVPGAMAGPRDWPVGDTVVDRPDLAGSKPYERLDLPGWPALRRRRGPKSGVR